MATLSTLARQRLERRSTSLEAIEGNEKPRLRERARADGIEALDDEGILGLLVERGGPGEPLEARVARVLRDAGGLGGLAALGVGALADELGLGEACACRIAAGFELGIRLARHRSDGDGQTLGSVRDVASWGRRTIATLRHEELWVLLVDARNRLRGARMVARGGVHACAVTPADVLRPAVREAASAFVVVHNHPGGDPTPSPEDVAFTRKLAASATVVGVALLDHVVVAAEGAVSMLEVGMLS